MPWALQDAKNRLSEVVRQARSTGPQVITVRGKEMVVVISVEDYRKATRPKGSLVEFLRSSPWSDVELDLKRSDDPGRDLDL